MVAGSVVLADIPIHHEAGSTCFIPMYCG